VLKKLPNLHDVPPGLLCTFNYLCICSWLVADGDAAIKIGSGPEKRPKGCYRGDPDHVDNERNQDTISAYLPLRWQVIPPRLSGYFPAQIEVFNIFGQGF
jgi:hypothetical protein